ncbi:MAG: hypothetical protein ACR2RV_04795 [Verrucomicrobiales bacterium]
MIISHKKIAYPVSPALWEYLEKWRRTALVPKIYQELGHFNEAYPHIDPNGMETLWQTVLYPPEEFAELKPKLTTIYAMLKVGGDMSLAEHLDVDRVDFGQFGNSKPFRVRIVNRYNDNFDHYYVKVADASRIYGLELEHILSPNRINYMVHEGTLIEEHIAGVPGDNFMDDHVKRSDINKVRVAKEFVKFNERCFMRLLGDMRSVNYVIEITPDFEEVQYRVRPIDFDQQSYEGRRNIYLAQFFKDNLPVVELVTEHLNLATIRQYQNEERNLMASRKRLADRRLTELLDIMRVETLSPTQKVEQLGAELAEYHAEPSFESAKTMGEMVLLNLNASLRGL